MQETEAHPKIKLLKAKLIKAKLIGPHLAAKAAVAKNIKAKTAIAAAQTFAAVSPTILSSIRFRLKTIIIHTLFQFID